MGKVTQVKLQTRSRLRYPRLCADLRPETPSFAFVFSLLEAFALHPELDALRGLAAMVVVLTHFSRLWDAETPSSQARLLLGGVLLPFFNAASAVMLFFLLSGFVLSLPYRSGTELAIPSFCSAGSAHLFEWSGVLMRFHLFSLVRALANSGGCGILVVALCSRRVSRLLNHRLPAWMGRVSYSLYLVHGTMLFTLVHLFLGRLTRLQLLGPYLLLSFGMAALFFFAVEKPCIRLSRNIGRHVHFSNSSKTADAS